MDSRRIMVVRHGERGDGTNAPKNQLSPKGRADALELGRNLPQSMLGAPIGVVGGSVHSRSYHTVLLVALSAGQDPQFLPSHSGLGSEKDFFLTASTDWDGYKRALQEHKGIDIDATRALMGPQNYLALKMQLREAVYCAFRKCPANEHALLGSHNPWMQIFLEYVLGNCEYHGVAKELDWIVVECYANGIIKFVETSMILP